VCIHMCVYMIGLLCDGISRLLKGAATLLLGGRRTGRRNCKHVCVFVCLFGWWYLIHH
jgi:hypothetical protein